jgi:hypothetical protein
MFRSAFRNRIHPLIHPVESASSPADPDPSQEAELGTGHSERTPPHLEPEQQRYQQSEQPPDQPQQQPDDPDQQPSIGEQLVAARGRLGMSIAEASAETRIEAGYLEALEADAPPSDLLGPAYARLFLKTYAKHLHLDAVALLEAYDRAHGAPPVQRLPSPAVKVPRGLVASVLVMASVGAIAVIALRSSSQGPPSDLEAATPRPTTVPGTPPPSPTAAPPAAPAQRGIRAALVVEEACWVEATVDDEVLLSETLQPGRRVSLNARRTLTFVLGNAGGVRLRINGTPVSTGGRGEVVHLAWEWQRGQLLTPSPET